MYKVWFAAMMNKFVNASTLFENILSLCLYYYAILDLLSRILLLLWRVKASYLILRCPVNAAVFWASPFVNGARFVEEFSRPLRFNLPPICRG